jgi:hypothetical protein
MRRDSRMGPIGYSVASAPSLILALIVAYRMLRELSAHVVEATSPKEVLHRTADIVSTAGK